MISKVLSPPVWQLALFGAIACDCVCESVCACFESSNNSRNTKARTQARTHLRAYEIHMPPSLHSCMSCVGKNILKIRFVYVQNELEYSIVYGMSLRLWVCVYGVSRYKRVQLSIIRRLLALPH